MGKKSKNRQKWWKNRTAQSSHTASNVRRVGFQRPVAAPVTEFGRPKGKHMTVSFTGKNDFPDVIISPTAHGKMLALVQECPIEISWMNSVTVLDNGDFQIDDVYVPLQSCGPADTVISEEGDEAMMMELMEAGKLEELNKLRCWGHSHVNMGVFASGTDESQTQDFLDNLHEAGSDHFIRFIGNKRGELLCNVYLLNKGIILNNPTMKIRVDGLDYSEWAKTQIKDKVTRMASVARYPMGGYRGPYGGASTGVNTGYNPSGVGAGGFWANGNFIEDDLNSEPDALFDDVQDQTAASGYADFLDDPKPLNFDNPDDEFVHYPNPEDRDDDGYDFATRGQ